MKRSESSAPAKRPATSKKRMKKPERGASRASLREMPELTQADFARARNNPHAARIAKDGYETHVIPAMGRPRKGEPSRPTTTCAVRLTEKEREVLEKRAARAKLSLHAYLRKLILTAA